MAKHSLHALEVREGGQLELSLHVCGYLSGASMNLGKEVVFLEFLALRSLPTE